MAIQQLEPMRNGTVEVKLPYPIKILGGTFYRNRIIGFSFDQLSMLIILKNNNVDMKKYSAWRKKINNNKFVIETMFAAAQSYCKERRLKDNFTKKGLLHAFDECSNETRELIAACWKDSEELGYKELPGKKKAVKH